MRVLVPQYRNEATNRSAFYHVQPASMDVVTRTHDSAAAGAEDAGGQARRKEVQREKTGREKRKERRMQKEPQSVTGRSLQGGGSCKNVSSKFERIAVK